MMRNLNVIGLISLLIVFSGCGGGGGGTSSTNPTVLVGGSVQGGALSLIGTVITIAGTAGTSGSADGIGSAASFTGPSGITTDGGTLYVADSFNGTIRKIVILTGDVSTLAGAAGTFGSDDGSGAAARFGCPKGITTDGIDLYVTDCVGTIRKVTISSEDVTTIAGTAHTIGSADGIGSAANFNNPAGITTDGINLYVTDGYELNSKIRRIIISTGDVTTLPTVAGTFMFRPFGITTDGRALYMADKYNQTIRKIQ
jgi:hypothetical protein